MQPTTVIPSSTSALVARRVPFNAIPRADWDRLLAVTASATPFARWTFHRAWWDAYGTTAHDEYLSLCAPYSDEVRAIVPLMHRHEVEPEDALTRTVIREHSPSGQQVQGDAKAVMFGASYHADYATVLAAASDHGSVAGSVANWLAETSDRLDGNRPWDVVDLRRLRAVDPALPHLGAAFADAADREGWSVLREQEDVCPVVTVNGDTWDDYLATLDKTARHEIRRKLRRAAAIGDLSIEIVSPTAEVIDEFIRLHNLRFGAQGLFPENEGGARSRRFIHRLAELERTALDGGAMHVALVRCGSRLIFAGVGFDDGQTTYLYNAGIDPEASTASPGISGVALLIQERIAAGIRRFDFLRGQERYKYEWGAVDEPIFRLLVTRGTA